LRLVLNQVTIVKYNIVFIVLNVTAYLEMIFQKNKIYNGNALTVLKSLPSASINQCVTSPPYYGLRTYDANVTWDNGNDCIHNWKIKLYEGTLYNRCTVCHAWQCELGLEPNIEMYIEHLVSIFNEVKRVLRKDGSCWVVISDTHASGGGLATEQSFRRDKAINTLSNPDYPNKSKLRSKMGKSLLMIPERFALSMISNGWILRNKIIWQKGNVMPSSAKDRYTIDYENVYFFTKSQDYYWKTQYNPYSDATYKEFFEKYKGQARKNYEDNNVQNPSNVKRSIIKSLGKTWDTYCTKYITGNGRGLVNGMIDKRKESRNIAVELFDSKEEQQKFINWVHDHGMKMPKFGGNKKAGGQNATYSGKEWIPLPQGSLARTVWKINTKGSDIAHYAVYPEELVTKMIDAGCPEKGTVIDPFIGSGTTALTALKMGRNFVGIEMNKEYCDIAIDRINFIKNVLD
jgi:DNA modification methylase